MLDLYEHYLIREYGFKRLLPRLLWFLCSIVCLVTYIITWDFAVTIGKIGTITWFTCSGISAFLAYKELFLKFKEYYTCTETDDGSLVLNPRTTKKGNLRADMMICYPPTPDTAEVLVLEDIKIKNSVLSANKCIHLRQNRKPEIIEDYEQELKKKTK